MDGIDELDRNDPERMVGSCGIMVSLERKSNSPIFYNSVST